MKTYFNSTFQVPGGELCAGCYTARTHMWNPTKDVPVCTACSQSLRVKDLPSKKEWFEKLKYHECEETLCTYIKVRKKGDIK